LQQIILIDDYVKQVGWRFFAVKREVGAIRIGLFVAKAKGEIGDDEEAIPREKRLKPPDGYTK